jgi:hypothetical protein
MSRTINSASGRTLALGWAAAVAMWAAAYVAMMGPGLVIGEVLFAVMLLCPVLFGHKAGRDSARIEVAAGQPICPRHSMVAGAKVGLVASLVNLLIVGSLLVDPQTHQLQPLALWWIIGNFAVTIVLAGAGGLMGARRLGEAAGAAGSRSLDGPVPPRWFNLFVRVAAAAVGLLLITGGLVTGLKAGLAVPDWPGTFGHNMLLFPLSQMTEGRPGVYYEHAHRL